MKLNFKRILFLCCVFVLSTMTLSYAGTLIKKVYFSSFPIYVDGEEYSSENPILSYQNRTYMPLREFAEMLDVKVDFKDGKIYLATPSIEDNTEFEENKDVLHSEKEESLKENENIENDVTVFISKSGTKYHKIKQCTKANYYPVSLSKAKEQGYTACLKCYKKK